MKTFLESYTIFVSSLILILLSLLFGSLVWGGMLHPSDNASVSDDVRLRRWPNGVIPYTVVVDSTVFTKVVDSTVFTNAQVAINEFNNNKLWEELTQGAVRFVKITPPKDPHKGPPYIEINLTDNSATSHLRGMMEAYDKTPLAGGIRDPAVKINPTKIWDVNHELGHVLGMWHLQRHPDSEQCVTHAVESPPQLEASKFIGKYSSVSVMHSRNDSSRRHFESWVTDPSGSTICPETPFHSNPISDFDVNYVLKMYGVNGEYLNHTDWCSGKGQRVFMGDFNGDGLDDLLCHAKKGGVNAGHRFIDYAQLNSADVFGSGDWEKTSNTFCRSAHRNLYVGDFNGDEKDDLLCHDSNDGRRFIDHANDHGHLNGTDARLNSYCAGSGKTIYVGDYDGDGKDDMLCHTKNSGALSIDYAIDGFNGQNWFSNDAWCKKATRSIIVGNFNLGNRDDMICHDMSDGRLWIDYANSSGHFGGAEWNSKKPFSFCWGSNRTVYAADVDGNGQDDLICHNREIGSIAVDFASSSNRNEGSQLWGTNTFREISFCNAQDAHLLVGRLPKNSTPPQSDSLFCHNRATGHQAARFDFD